MKRIAILLTAISLLFQPVVYAQSTLNKIKLSDDIELVQLSPRACVYVSLQVLSLIIGTKTVWAAWPSTIAKVISTFPSAEIVIPGHGQFGGKELLFHTQELLRKLSFKVSSNGKSSKSPSQGSESLYIT